MLKDGFEHEAKGQEAYQIQHRLRWPLLRLPEVTLDCSSDPTSVSDETWIENRRDPNVS